MSKKILVAGASAAGLKAAARARRLLPDAEITVLDERDVISYGACGLPYFLSGDVDSIRQLRETSYNVLRDPEFFEKAKGLDVRTGMRIVGMDVEAKTLSAEIVDGGGSETFSWDELVIATGAAPRCFPGVEIGGAVGFFHNPEQVMALRQGLETGQIGSVAVVGAGFIGCEVAAAFAELWGCEVTLIEAADRVLPQVMDVEMSALVAGELARNKIKVLTRTPVESVVTENGAAVVTAGGKTFQVDRAVIAAGVIPRVEWAASAGLDVGPRGGLVVDENMRTSRPDVFAAGDCVELRHALTGESVVFPQGSLANRQGRVVGDNLAGRTTGFGSVVGAACVKVFEWNIAVCGLSASAAASAGLSAREAWISADDMAHFYPDHAKLFLKLVYEEPSRRLLGLQVVGPGEAVKRADVFAGLLQRGATLEGLLGQEFSYSPPYNSALDPLFALGCVAMNDLDDGLQPVAPFSDHGDRVVVDVRNADEITDERPAAKGALLIPLMELRERTGEIPLDRPVLMVCAYGTRSAEAARYLTTQGHGDIRYLAGGITMKSFGEE